MAMRDAWNYDSLLDRAFQKVDRAFQKLDRAFQRVDWSSDGYRSGTMGTHHRAK